MTNIILLERPETILRSGPVMVYARHRGRYTRPIAAYGIDFRLEDNPAVDKSAMMLNATWLARHPMEDLYIAWQNGGLLNSRTTPEQVRELIDRGELPERPYLLPDRGDAAWWEWIIALGRDYQIIKAPKLPREDEYRPEEVDELHTPVEDLEVRLGRLLSPRYKVL